VTEPKDDEKGSARDRRVSLHPVPFGEAVADLMKVKPQKRAEVADKSVKDERAKAEKKRRQAK
jgi:hypothetical protein